jgi:hypothetical protein
MSTGTTVCRYIVEAQYTGKQPFLVGTFAVPRQRTDHDTETEARKEATRELAKFWTLHMQDGIAPPVVLSVRLGSLTFVPDDYEWRRV